ncbi:CpaD family pilus assembly protein [Methylobacterium nonmethylotrophicum]|uniref:Pilus assembly protein CpaD n=1 Tax=Methylobacterium nonmethylotrophicum TaxID=1141884 RepID=A0A4Z0NQJ7_9HYPH|nr:CpaD family pilus assembly protein [Methylobacterium nonmethylotrophicum]TGD98595.1 pilus assembly protein CpaD [Methylobacterium nonmethylotrophicum]
MTRSALRLTVLAASACLAACASDRAQITGSTYPGTVTERHPIVLSDTPRNLDVFVTGTGHLDPRQADDIDGFLLEYRRYGRGVLALEVPRGSQVPGPAVERTLARVRARALARGVGPREIVIAPYPVANVAVSAPLRLSFQRMQAKVAGACGLWPQDLGVTDPGFNARNETYWNFGCATQSNVASQIADPVDLVRGRQEGRIDTVIRTQDLLDLRTGKDPSTTWKQDGRASVKSQVAQ